MSQKLDCGSQDPPACGPGGKDIQRTLNSSSLVFRCDFSLTSGSGKKIIERESQGEEICLFIPSVFPSTHSWYY